MSSAVSAVVCVTVFSLQVLHARVLYPKQDEKFNSSVPLVHYNDVTQWDIDEGLDPEDLVGNMYPEEPDYPESPNPIGEVVSLLSTMSEEITMLRSQMGNLKYQNHLIYKQLKRMNNRCMASPVRWQEMASDSPGRQDIMTAHSVVKVSKCPRDYTLNEQTGNCYKFATDRIPWRMAREKCRAQGGDIVSVTSSGMQQYVTETARRNKDLYHCDFWIGATDQQNEGQWRWTGTNELLSYSNWNHNEPNNGNGDEHCALMLWVFNWKWNDARCKSDRACYVCEKPLKAI